MVDNLFWCLPLPPTQDKVSFDTKSPSTDLCFVAKSAQNANTEKQPICWKVNQFNRYSGMKHVTTYFSILELVCN